MTDVPNDTWPPDRKVIAGGIGAVVSWAVVYAAKNYFEWDVPTEIQTAIPGLVAVALAYFVPPSAYDIVRRLNNTLVALAARDPKSPVRAVVVPAAAPPGTEAVAQVAVNNEIRKV